MIFLCLALLLCLPLASYAASIGGVETQGQGKFAIGLDQEFVFDRDGKTFTKNRNRRNLNYSLARQNRSRQNVQDNGKGGLWPA